MLLPWICTTRILTDFPTATMYIWRCSTPEWSLKYTSDERICFDKSILIHWFFFSTCHFIFQHLQFYFYFLWLAKFNSKPINVKLPDLHIWFLNSLISRKSFSSHTKIFEKVLLNSISDKFYHHLLKSNFFVNRYTLLY